MIVRLLLVLLFCSSFAADIHASTITFLHNERTEVKLKNAAYPTALNYSPKFEYPRSTIFQLPKSSVQLYIVITGSQEYYFWLKDSDMDIEIDLSESKSSSSNFSFISKDDWLAGNINSDDADLEKLNQLDIYYSNALDSLKSLAQTSEDFRAEIEFSTVVWDSRSAKRLYNLAVEKFIYQSDEEWLHYSPAYIRYWEFMYKLFYQYYHTNSFKEQSNNEMKSTIETDFNYPESKVLIFQHFFREGLPINELKDHYEFLVETLDPLKKNIAEAYIQNQAVENLSNNRNIDFLFGIDIDAALEGFFARDSTNKKNVLIFWSIWDSDIATEFNLLANLKENFGKEYKFIHVCIDAYESPEKAKSFIYQNRVDGFHLLPEQSSAFRKSNFRKNLKMRTFPFYVLTDPNGEILVTESVPFVVSDRLKHKIEYLMKKK